MGRNNELLNYVEIVYNIEKQRYRISNAIQNIDNQITNANQRIHILKQQKGEKIEKLYEKENLSGLVVLYGCIGFFLGLYAGGIIGFCADCLQGSILEILGGLLFGVPLSFFWPVFGPLTLGKSWFSSSNLKFAIYGFLIGILLGILIGVIVYVGHTLNNNEKNKLIAEKNKQILLRNKSLKEKNEAEICRLESWLTQDLYPEKKKLSNLLKQTEKLRQINYSKNIIGEKYRDLIPVSFFYEYLYYGRCETLTGHEGAYNIFENFVLLNNIKLGIDTIIQQLEEIKCKQEMLFSAIQENEKQNTALISGLKKQLKEISSNQRECIEVIEYNSRCAEEQRRYANYLLTIGIINRY